MVISIYDPITYRLYLCQLIMEFSDLQFTATLWYLKCFRAQVHILSTFLVLEINIPFLFLPCHTSQVSRTPNLTMLLLQPTFPPSTSVAQHILSNWRVCKIGDKFIRNDTSATYRSLFVKSYTALIADKQMQCRHYERHIMYHIWCSH